MTREVPERSTGRPTPDPAEPTEEPTTPETAGHAPVGQPMWRLVLDQRTCIGSGMCSSSAPNYFALDSEGVSQPLSELVNANDIVVDAANSCPVEAITVIDVATDVVVAPND